MAIDHQYLILALVGYVDNYQLGNGPELLIGAWQQRQVSYIHYLTRTHKIYTNLNVKVIFQIFTLTIRK